MPKVAQQPSSPILPADKAAALTLTPVSRETEVRLDRYVDLLLQWQAKTNLVAPSTLPKSVDPAYRGFTAAFDARAVSQGLGRSRQRRRFSGVVLACAMAESPGAMVHLVERNAKKAAFLREALRVTNAHGVSSSVGYRG